MTAKHHPNPLRRGRFSPLFRMVGFALASVALWSGAQAAGDYYARATYTRQMSECARQMDTLARAIRAYRKANPHVPWTQIQPEMLQGKWVRDAKLFRCPSVAMAADPVGERELQCTYVWCVGSRDWDYVHRRRGEKIPILACLSHTRTQVSDGTVNLVRISGPAVRIKQPLGISTDEY